MVGVLLGTGGTEEIHFPGRAMDWQVGRLLRETIEIESYTLFVGSVMGGVQSSVATRSSSRVPRVAPWWE